MGRALLPAVSGQVSRAWPGKPLPGKENAMRLPARRVVLTAASVATLVVPLLSVPLTGTPAAAAAGTGPSFLHGVLPPPPSGSTSTYNQAAEPQIDRKSTRLNSSHTVISYAVFCLKKKKKAEKAYLQLTPDRAVQIHIS